MNAAMSVDLGQQRYFRLSDWNGAPRVDIREWLENGIAPTKRGLSFPLQRFKVLMVSKDCIDQHLQRLIKDEDVSYELHLGGNVYVSLQSPLRIIDIRQRFLDSAGVLRPTRRGVALRVKQWEQLKGLFLRLEQLLPEIVDMIPCFLSPDHQNQQGALMCPECNPNYYQNFAIE
jgi:hypothetical protein